MWSRYINMKYDEDGKPITIFDELKAILKTELSFDQIIANNTDAGEPSVDN